MRIRARLPSVSIRTPTRTNSGGGSGSGGGAASITGADSTTLGSATAGRGCGGRRDRMNSGRSRMMPSASARALSVVGTPLTASGPRARSAAGAPESLSSATGVAAICRAAATPAAIAASVRTIHRARLRPLNSEAHSRLAGCHVRHTLPSTRREPQVRRSHPRRPRPGA